jgi:hypothetical protein
MMQRRSFLGALMGLAATPVLAYALNGELRLRRMAGSDLVSDMPMSRPVLRLRQSLK